MRANGELILRRKPDPAIIHAAEGVTLEPGEYDAVSFVISSDLPSDRRRFRIGGAYPAKQTALSGTWHWQAVGWALTAVRRVEAKAQQESSLADSVLVNGEPGFINYCSICCWMGFNSACPNCKGDRGLRLYVRAKDEPAQPDGQAQPDAECARCGGSGRLRTRNHEGACPGCKGTGRARVAAGSDPLGICEPEQCHKYHAKILEENAALRERLEDAKTVERERADLHRCLCNIVNGLGNSSGAAPTVSAGFLCQADTETLGVLRQLRERLEAAERRFADVVEDCEHVCKQRNQYRADAAHWRNERNSSHKMVDELTEKLVTFEREARAWKVIEQWFDECSGERSVELKAVHSAWLVTLNSTTEPMRRFEANRVLALRQAAEWCESQLASGGENG